MSALPIKNTGNNQPSALTRATKPRLRIRKEDASETTPSISMEEEARANFPNNPRGQELDIKIRQGKATPDEKLEFRKIVASDGRLMDILCGQLLVDLLKNRE